MDKVLINLFVPSMDAHYDIMIPKFLPIKTVCELLSKSLEEVSVHNFVPNGDEIICSVDRNIVLDANLTFNDYNILNGEHLIIC